MILAVRTALKGEIEGSGQSRRGIDVGEFEALIDGIGSNDSAKEIVVVFAVEKRGEIGGAVFADHSEWEAVGRIAAGRQERLDRNAFTGLVIANEPVDALRGEWRVDPGSIEFNGATRRIPESVGRRDMNGLFHTFGEEAKRTSVKVRVEAGGNEIRKRDAVPAFMIDGDFDGVMIGDSNAGRTRRRRRDKRTRGDKRPRNQVLSGCGNSCSRMQFAQEWRNLRICSCGIGSSDAIGGKRFHGGRAVQGTGSINVGV